MTSVDALERGLRVLTQTQAAGAKLLPAHLHPYDAADFRSAILLTFTELGELMNEAKAKSWRTYGPPTEEERTRMLDEFADVLHGLPWMMNNLMERFGVSERDFAEAFLRKAEENRARFEGRVPGREPPRE
jgi:hypothetical protein